MQKIIKHLKYLLFEPKENLYNHKTLILYHGWGGTAEGYTELAEELLEKGYKVIVPEILYHDTREPLENHYDQKTLQAYFWKIITNSIDEFNEFISEIGIKKEETILIGSSMGGFIANGIFAREMRLAGLANINGSGSYILTERLFRSMDGRGSIPPELEMTLSDYDPVKKENCPSSVLLIHGDSDKIIPIDGQKDYYRYLAEEQKRDNVEFHIHKEVNHQFTTEMVIELMDWLDRI
ncbi:alpha/beta hydrolase [Falsibacillus pallidus]|uniref:alpha/beta hydrolase n=1 Tax=Falsibacillus pallidus TaxID=493781 RepID=UPI003D972305